MNTNETIAPPPTQSYSVLEGLKETRDFGCTILSPATKRPFRRVLYLDNYGGLAMWEKIKKGDMPGHHLRGCIELARMGYEVAFAEPIPDFVPRHPFPHDLKLLKIILTWLRRDGIVFCGHNVLYWLPFLKSLGLIRCRIVSNLWAIEDLDWARKHSGIIGLTPAGAEQAKKLAPNVKVAHLGWGADLRMFPQLPFNPQWLLHCGIAGRDFRTLSQAAAICGRKLRVISPGEQPDVTWPANAEVIDSGRTLNFQAKKVSYQELVHVHYAGSAASLVINRPDPTSKDAFGFTNVVEAMALGQPIVLTRSGALPDEIDVEKHGCGFFVPPGDAAALAKVMDQIMSDPDQTAAMGRASRKLCETHFNTDRYAADLHRFFETL